MGPIHQLSSHALYKQSYVDIMRLPKELKSYLDKHNLYKLISYNILSSLGLLGVMLAF